MNKYFKELIIFLFPFSYLFLLLFQKDLSLLEDLGRHLKVGEVVLHCKCVPQTNLFSYTHPDFPFVNHEWLSQVFFYITSILFGLNGILVLKIILCCIAFSILYYVALRKSSSFWVFLVAFPVITLFSMRFRVRPELFSFLFIALFIFIIERYKETKNIRLLWILPIIQTLWVNMHIFFVFGLSMYFFFFLEEYLKKKVLNKPLLYIGLILGFVNLLNPSFITGALLPFTVFSNYGFSVEENISPFTFLSYSQASPIAYTFLLQIFVFEFMLLLIPVLLFVKTIRKSVFYMGNAAVITILGVLFIRCIGLFGLFIFSPLSQAFFELEKRLKASRQTSHTVKGIIVLIVLLVVSIHIKGLFEYQILHFGYVPYAENAADFLIKNNIKGAVFNNYRIGSYLIYRLYPGQQVYVDSRPEAYPKEFFTDYQRMMDDHIFFAQTVEKYGINAIVFGVQDENTASVRPFLIRIIQSTEWVPVYADGAVTIFVKNIPENKTIIEKYKINFPQ